MHVKLRSQRSSNYVGTSIFNSNDIKPNIFAAIVTRRLQAKKIYTNAPSTGAKVPVNQAAR